MVKKFEDNPTIPGRAVQIWQILVSKAHNRQIITYGILADYLGLAGAIILAQPLNAIMYFCSQNELPPLTAIVVNAKTGLPGEGLKIDGDLNAVREDVFNYNWYGIIPPNETQFSEAQRNAKEKRDLV